MVSHHYLVKFVASGRSEDERAPLHPDSTPNTGSGERKGPSSWGGGSESHACSCVFSPRDSIDLPPFSRRYMVVSAKGCRAWSLPVHPIQSRRRFGSPDSISNNQDCRMTSKECDHEDHTRLWGRSGSVLMEHLLRYGMKMSRDRDQWTSGRKELFS